MPLRTDHPYYRPGWGTGQPAQLSRDPRLRNATILFLILGARP